MYGATKKNQGYVNCGISQSNNTPGSTQFYLDNTTVLNITNGNKVHSPHENIDKVCIGATSYLTRKKIAKMEL